MDPAGIVFFPRFFEWYDLGGQSLFEAYGLAYKIAAGEGGGGHG